TERLTNYALQFKTRDEFIAQLTANLPQRPEYFFADVELNRSGAEALDHSAPLHAIPASEVRGRKELLLDTRPCEDFAAGHVPGSVSISLSGQFASWAGAVLGTATPIILICESREKVEESRMRLARVGIENIAGYLADGIMGWFAAGYELKSLRQIDAGHLRDHMDEYTIIDVRNAGEWDNGHIETAMSFPLGELARKQPNLPANAHIAVHCKSGYRSTIASSLLLRAGFTDVTN